jgi:hypothetical protein
LIFFVSDIAVDILTELGFYEKMEKRGRGIVPNVTSRFAEFNTKFTIMDLVRQSCGWSWRGEPASEAVLVDRQVH